MASIRVLLFSASVLTLAAIGACADGDSSGDATGGDDGGGPNVVGEGGVGTGDSGPPQTTMRLAHLAEDLGPIDFCYRAAKSASFEGPVLDRGPAVPKSDAGDGGADTGADDDAGADADAGDGGTHALTHATMSSYTTLDAAGPLEIAIVPSGSSSCAAPLLVADVTLDPGKLSTVALLGRSGDDAGDALGVVAFTDDHTTTQQKARVRFVHGAVGTAVPLAVRVVGAQAVLAADRIDPRHAAAAAPTIPVDDLGYATIAPVPPPASLAIAPVAAQDGASVQGWQTSASDLGLVGGSLHTGFVLAGTSTPYEVLWCTDTSTTGPRTTCVLVR